jgi:hypothetical protein
MFENVPGFNPSCKLCNDLSLPDEIYAESLRTNIQFQTWYGYLHEFRRSANGCLLCSAIEKTASYFVKRAWRIDVDNSNFVRIDVTIRIPGEDCAGIGVKLESFEGLGITGHVVAEDINDSQGYLPPRLYFELCPDEGTKTDCNFPS